MINSLLDSYPLAVPLCVAAVAIYALLEVVKKGLAWKWGTIRSRKAKFVLQLVSVTVGALLGLVWTRMPGETAIERVMVGIGVGTFADYVYVLIRKRLVRMLNGKPTSAPQSDATPDPGQ